MNPYRSAWTPPPPIPFDWVTFLWRKFGLPLFFFLLLMQAQASTLRPWPFVDDAPVFSRACLAFVLADGIGIIRHWLKRRSLPPARR